ncbi:MAG: RusA family crossover junction endodeoxyribonuclease [Planctomycetia bacterium]|nr:RusA family crossover junction endodeoxyribonuclease [Planctomycetia bacterium]
MLQNASPIQTKILQLFKDKNRDKESLLKEIIKIYNTETVQNIDFNKIIIQDEELIQRWLNKSDAWFLDLDFEKYRKRSWFKNENDKMNYFIQHNCKICNIIGLRHFPIRISPMSSQIKSNLKNKFQELLKTAPYLKIRPTHFKNSDRICLRLIFVIKESREKDVDNMAKITIDGLEEILIPDDKQIDHLEVIKFKTKYLEEHISISIGRSHLNERENILFRGLNMGWAGLEKMNISN